MTYRAAIAYLNTLRSEARVLKDDLSLEPIHAFLHVLQNPHLQFPAVHIGGTAGKGTTATMIASILRAAGYRVGLTLSPHLETPRERIQINGRMISQKEFGALIGEVARASRESAIKRPSYFETLIAAAFLCFSRQKVDITVVEVGLGGRLDATNVVRPVLSVITNVDFDHTEVLGKTIAKIAREKSGIIKPGVPVLTGARQKEPLRMIRAIARARGAPFTRVPLPRPSPSRGRERVGGSSMDDTYRPALLGLGAQEDARIAKKAAEILRARGWRTSDRAIRMGLKDAFIPGRMEVISRRPLVIFDGAHNPLKIRTLVKSIQMLFPRKRFTIMVAINHTKPYRLILRLLKPIAARFVCTEFGRGNIHQSYPAALLAKATGRVPATMIRDPRKALFAMLKTAQATNAILITGSLYLVGTIRLLTLHFFSKPTITNLRDRVKL